MASRSGCCPSLDEQRLTAHFIERDIPVVVVDPVTSTVRGNVDLNRNNEVRDLPGAVRADGRGHQRADACRSCT